MPTPSVGGAATVAEIIDAVPISALQRTVFALCVLVSMLDGFNTQSIAFVAPSIAREWGLTPLDFGYIFSATLLGSVVGTSLFGMLADRFGRARLTVAATLLFGAFSGLAVFAHGFGALVACRVIGGIGLGGAIPNTMALASEYAPQRSRATIVTMTLWGFPVGSILGGLASGPIIHDFGWRAVFLVGAILPLALVPVLIWLLPESIRYLSTIPKRRDEVAKLLARMAPGYTIAPPPAVKAAATARRGNLAELFGPRLAATTTLLATALFMSLLLTYLLVNWVPMILSQAGLPLSSAILGTVGINLGGIVGSFLLSRAIDRSPRPMALLGGGYLAAGLALVLVGLFVSTSGAYALIGLTLCGFLLVGSQMSMTAFTSTQFPVALRGTGIGFVQAIGRIGSLVGPMAGGLLLSRGLAPAQLFTFCIGPALLASLALFILSRIRAGHAWRLREQLEAGAEPCPARWTARSRSSPARPEASADASPRRWANAARTSSSIIRRRLRPPPAPASSGRSRRGAGRRSRSAPT